MTGAGDPAPAWSSAPAWSQPDAPAPDGVSVAHASAGRYELRELLGRGGMGEVWVARDTLLGRDVALKRPRPGTTADDLLREANLAALLEHPGIVPVHDAVLLPDGQGLYVMRLVRGRNLAQALADLPDDLQRQADARCRLVAHVVDACRAVAFAHAVGVLHRDLKSDNLLIGELGDTQVADWGLAGRATDATAPASPSPAGCPAYLSPQRANGASATPQDDVFALGAVLYEVVAGCPPFAERDVDGQWRRARAGDRAAPSAVWAYMPAELRAIATRATDPEPALRYANVAELAADLERWSSGRRVHAHSYSPVELARRFIATFRLPLLVAAVALGVVTVLVVAGVRRIAGERDQAEAARRAATQAHGVAQQQLAETLAMQARSFGLLGDRPAAETSAAQALRRHDHPVARGVLAAFDLQPRPSRVALRPPWPCNNIRAGANGACVACLGDDEVRWQCDAQTGRAAGLASDVAFVVASDRVALAQGATLTMATLTGEVVGRVQLAAGRTLLLVADQAAAIAVVQSRAAHVIDGYGRTAGLHVGCANTHLLAAALHAQGQRLAVACVGGTFATAAALGGQSDFPAPWVDQMRGVVALALPTDQTAVALGIDGSLAVVDARDGTLRALWRAGGVAEVAALLVPPDSDTAAVLGAVGGISWVRWTDGAVLGRVPAAGARYLARIGDGGVAATGETLSAWRAPTPATPVVLDAGVGLTSVDGSVDGRWLAAGAGTGELLLWSLPDGKLVRRERVCANTAKDVQFFPDGRTLLVACVGAPGLLQVTYADGRWGPPTTVAPVESRRAGRLASGRIWLTDTVQGLRLLQGSVERQRIVGPGFVEGDTSADARRAFAIGPRGGVWQIDDGAAAAVERWPRAAAVAVAVSADGAVVALAGAATAVTLDVATGRERQSLAVQSGVQDLAVSADGLLVAVAYIDGAIAVIGGNRAGTRLLGHRQRTVALRFLPGGTALASASWDGTVRLWSVRALTESPEKLAGEVENAWTLP